VEEENWSESDIVQGVICVWIVIEMKRMYLLMVLTNATSTSCSDSESRVQHCSANSTVPHNNGPAPAGRARRCSHSAPQNYFSDGTRHRFGARQLRPTPPHSPTIHNSKPAHFALQGQKTKITNTFEFWYTFNTDPLVNTPK
jgi:hypothetical protein